MLNPIYNASMNDQQRAWFFAEYREAAKDEVVGVLLALFLGSFGIHRFYLGQTGLGVLYLLFSWTGIPAILGFVECFLMPGRVRDYNAAQGQYIASGIMASSPAAPVAYAPAPAVAAISTTQPCQACGASVPNDAAFCAHCGAATAAATS